MDEEPRDHDPDLPLALDPDPVAQWLDWEEQANLVGFRASTRPIEIDVVSVPLEQLEVHILPGAPQAILRRFLQGDRVMFPRHPLNTDASVSFFDAEPSERWTARFTSSRTLALPGPESGAALSSLKLATDRPHPDFHQPEKTRLGQEAVDAVGWVRNLARIDLLLEPLREVILVTEVLVVLVAGRESGFMIRDLRLFQDGHYYLPALSLPFVGRQIARANGEDFAGFWARAYAAPVGRAKARLFARYGMWFETPNPQNLLIQLDPSLRPTGNVVFRDVGDGECATDMQAPNDIPWTKLVSDLRPETQNSFWAFGEAGEHAIAIDTLEAWYRGHDDAYFAELASWFPALAHASDAAPESRLAHWNASLRSPEAARAIRGAFEQRAAGRARP